jgi:uncharacterized membrane protein
MQSKPFFLYLGYTTLAVSGLLALLHVLLPETQGYWKLSLASVLLFVAVCAGLFFAGQNAAASKNKFAFNNLISVSVFGKMALSVLFLFLYREMDHPTDNWFVGIFLFCYIVYTSFEVWFMTRLAKM